MVKKFKKGITTDTANAVRIKGYHVAREDLRAFSTRNPLWVPANAYKYYDNNPNTKDSKDRDERIADRRARQSKKEGNITQGNHKTSKISKTKATIAAHKKLLIIKETQSKTNEM